MKKLFSLVMLALLSVGASAQMISWNEEVEAGKLEATYGSDGFILTRTDTSNKHSIGASNKSFGSAEAEVKFTHCFKVGGKSGSSSNAVVLSIPYAGTLKVYVVTSSSTATDRTLVLTQSSQTLYNKVVQESDKVGNYYPIISVPVDEGTVNVTYPVGALNFYGFELVESSEPVAPKAEAPTITAGSYDYVKGGWPITITSATEGATVSYKVGSGEYADVENGSTVYVQGGALTVKASKDDYQESEEVGVGTLNAAPSSTSPETLIAVFRNKDDYDKNKDHNYVSVSVNGDYIAGTYNNSDGMKFRANRNHASAATIDGYAFSLSVKDGYKVTGVKITAASNRTGEIKVSNMYIDGVAFEGFEEFTMPDTKATIEKNYSGLNATKEIAWELEPGKYETTKDVDQFNAKIEVTYAPTSETKEVTEYGWATYIPAYAAKFEEGDAYVITDVTDETVIIENVTEVPANTAVLLKGKGEKTITFVESATKPEKNLLEVYSEDKSDKVAYVLAKDEVNGAGFKKWGGEADLTGRAVLWLDNEIATARGFFALDGETTGIKSVATSVEDGTIYDLQGRRVAQPKAGLYIVNGKKVVIK